MDFLWQAEKEEEGLEGEISKKGEGESFVQLGDGLLGEALRGKGYKAKRFEVRKELREEGMNMWAKGVLRSKITPRNMGTGLNERVVPVKELMRSLVWVGPCWRSTIHILHG